MTRLHEQLGIARQGFDAARGVSKNSISFQQVETPATVQGTVTPLSQFALDAFVSRPPQAGVPEYADYTFPAAKDYPPGVVIPKAVVNPAKYRDHPPTEKIAMASVYKLEPQASMQLPRDPSAITAIHLSLASFMPESGQARISAGALELHAEQAYELGLSAKALTDLMYEHSIAPLRATYMPEPDTAASQEEYWRVVNPTHFDQLFAVIEASDPDAGVALKALNAQVARHVGTTTSASEKSSSRSPVTELAW